MSASTGSELRSGIVCFLLPASLRTRGSFMFFLELWVVGVGDVNVPGTCTHGALGWAGGC